MNFDYNEEQQLLADSVRRFLAKDYDFEARKKILASPEGASSTVWSQLAEMGLLGLPFSTDYGGFGGGAVDLMGPMEAFGETLVLEPFLANVALAGRLVSRTGSDAQKKAVLPGMVEGKLKLAFAHAEKGARYDLSAVKAKASGSGSNWKIDAEKKAVLGTQLAGRLVVSAMTAKGLSLFLVNSSEAKVKPCRTLDGIRSADVTLKGASAELLGTEGSALPHIEEAVDFATALVCAEAVGAMKYANDATLEYLKTRRQFGVPIGMFQALQHRMVEMFITCEQARSMACLACSKMDSATDARDRARAISAAKVKIADACRQVSQEAVQLHGGMGMTEELKVSHSFRRLTTIAQQFGDADYHLERFASL